MDQGIALIAIAIAALAAGVIVWLVLRRNLPPEAAEELAEAVAYIKQQLRGVVTEAEVRAMAAWIYDTLRTGSNYYTREQFIDLVTRAVMRALQNSDVVDTLVQRDSALAADLKRAAAR